MTTGNCLSLDTASLWFASSGSDVPRTSSRFPWLCWRWVVEWSAALTHSCPCPRRRRQGVRSGFGLFAFNSVLLHFGSGRWLVHCQNRERGSLVCLPSMASISCHCWDHPGVTRAFRQSGDVGALGGSCTFQVVAVLTFCALAIEGARLVLRLVNELR
ncbi:hypothetical protein AVEN_84925-1 [Araneus ventricosus]|uniref:Uncharacterized protein n=1 Tax=Araneus ventricosus TaxID=182803 RepID=A0A4Y2C0F7_ARAVE|nr:hypothetical protein AVEN_84925-1 [Araneus ventricosus]